MALYRRLYTVHVYQDQEWLCHPTRWHQLQWEKKWGIAFKPEMYSTIRVTRPRNPKPSSYTLKGHTLDMEDSTMYFGVELQSNMAWNRHQHLQEQDPSTPWNADRFLPPVITLSLASFLAQFVTGLLCQPGWSSQFGPSNWSSPICQCKLSDPPCKYTLGISLSYAVGDFMCPGNRRIGSLVRDWRAKTHWPKLLIYLLAFYQLFFWLSYFALSFSCSKVKW